VTKELSARSGQKLKSRAYHANFKCEIGNDYHSIDLKYS
jgi:hypothetical protein